MSLIDTAAADARAILGDAAGGFARLTTLEDPDGGTYSVPGIFTHVGLTIDPQTGVPVSGERASVTYSLAVLAGATPTPIALPVGEVDAKRKPWVVTTADTVGGKSRTWKIRATHPDRMLGAVVCLLETYRR